MMIAYTELKRLIGAYGSWVEHKVGEEGYDAYLLSFMFHALHGSHGQVHQIMTKAVERAYATALTRLFRYPNSQISARDPMIWIVVPDRPVPKHAKKHLWEVRLNNGVHMHAIALVPPFTRLQVGFDTHLKDHRALYARAPLMRLHGTAIETHLAEVTDYSMKSLKRRTVDYGDLFILPRMPDEVPARERV